MKKEVAVKVKESDTIEHYSEEGALETQRIRTYVLLDNIKHWKHIKARTKAIGYTTDQLETLANNYLREVQEDIDAV